MLTWMRTHQKTIMTWTLYLIIPSFVLLYGYGKIEESRAERWAVKVNGRKISYPELQRTEQNFRDQYRRQSGDRFGESAEDDFRQQAMDALIRRELILITAEQFGFGVSDNELREQIASIPGFQSDGKFNIYLYNRYLASTRMNREYFEQSLRQQMLHAKMASFINSTMIRPLPETEAQFKRRSRRVMAEMLAFRPSEYTEDVTVDEEGLLKYFKDRQEEYQIPEQRRIRYVEYVAEDYRDQIQVTEGRLRTFFSRNATDYTVEETRSAEHVLYAKANHIADVSPTQEDLKSYFERNRNRYQTERRIKVRFVASSAEEWGKRVEVTPEDSESWYERHKAQYTHPEEVHAQHILLRLSPDSTAEDETRVRTKVDEIRKEILDGLDFAEAAKQYSEDTGTASRGGDLGFFSKGRMAAPFSEAAFSLPIGEISEPVKTVYGFHIIRVQEKKESSVDPLSDVREEVEKNVRREKVRSMFQEFADGVQSLDHITDRYEIQTSDWFKRGDPVAGIDKRDSSTVFFTAGRGQVSEPPKPVFGSETYYLVELTGDEKPRPKEFEEAEEELQRDARDEMAVRQALLAAQADLGRLAAGQTTWEQVLRERNLTQVQTLPFSRSERFIAGLGAASRDFINAAYGLSKVGDGGGPVESDRGAYLLRLSDISEAYVPEELSEVKDRVTADFITSEAGNQAYQDAAKLADEAFNTEKPLTECAQKLDREVLESELFREGGSLEPLGYRQEVNERAFRMRTVGTVSDVISIYTRQLRPNEEPTGPVERCYVISLLEIKEPYLPELDEVRATVEKDYRLFLAADVSRRKAEEALALLKQRIAAGSPVSATRTVDLEALTTAGEGQEAVVDATYMQPMSITQASPFVLGVGRSTELRKTAFALAPGRIGGVIEVRDSTLSPEGELETGDVTGYYIIQVVGREEPGPLVLGQQEEQMEMYWEQNAQSMAFNAWIDSVSRSTPIEFNSELLWPSDLLEEETEESVKDEEESVKDEEESVKDEV